MKKGLIFLPLAILLLLFLPQKVSAEITLAKDVLTTSRPSAGTVLTAVQSASSNYVSIEDNGSLFLASDSAILRPANGSTLENVKVASMSAESGGTRTVFFTADASNAHGVGNPIIVPITATHTISFKTGTGVVDGGHVVITFPAGGASDTVPASPSAQTFMFNGIGGAQIDWSGVSCGSEDVTPPSSGVGGTIDCTTDADVAPNTTITATIGTAGNQRLINPTTSSNCLDTAPPGTCSADSWKITLRTQDASAGDIEYTIIKAATIQSVLVQAIVEPSITFTIAGLTTVDDATGNYQDAAGASCGDETTNTGIASTSTSVNLGFLNSGSINHAGQLLTVSTNGSSGYAITATSSGRFIDVATGSFLPDANIGNGLTDNDTPIPAAITAGTPAFGVSPCGGDVDYDGPLVDWGTAGTLVSSGNSFFSNPWNTGTNGYYATIASYGAGASSRETIVRYGATVSTTTPAGTYTTVLTYVATATF